MKFIKTSLSSPEKSIFCIFGVLPLDGSTTRIGILVTKINSFHKCLYEK